VPLVVGNTAPRRIDTPTARKMISLEGR